MADKPAIGQSRTIKVEQYSGVEREGVRLFLPLVPDTLMAKHPLYFDVYEKLTTAEIKLLLPNGSEVPLAIQSFIRLRKREAAKRFYLPASQREDLSRYQEAILPDLLSDADVPVLAKCNVLQNVTTNLSQEMFDSPTPLNIQRQRRNVEQMVDFTLHDPAALKGLLSLTHHDYFTYTHSVNVGVYALTIAFEHLYNIGAVSKSTLQRIAAGFFLHDIGKSLVPREVINKNGPLDEAEWEEMRKHPAHGHALLLEEGNLTPEVATVVLQHHEKMIGGGYPEGLKGDAIHLYARICSVADAFDALTTRRSYKLAVAPFDALAIMKKDMYAQFDPDVFQTFVLLMRKRTR